MKPSKSRRGSGLILLLVLMVVVGLLVGAWSEQLLVTLRQGNLLRLQRQADMAAESGMAAALGLLAAHPEIIPAATPSHPEEPLLVYEPEVASGTAGALRPDIKEQKMPKVGCGDFFIAVFYEGPGELRLEVLGRSWIRDGQGLKVNKVGIVKIVSERPVLIWERDI